MFTRRTKYFMKHLHDNFHDLEPIFRKSPMMKDGEYKKVILQLHKDMMEADVHVNQLYEHESISYTHHTIQSKKDIPTPKDGLSKIFMSDSIHNWITQQSSFFIQYTCEFMGENINVFFIYDDTCWNKASFEYCNKYIRWILMWFYIANVYARKECSQELNVYIFMNSTEKTLPTSSIDPLNASHMNSGYTTCCTKDSSIVIFRREEWFKVLLHETFHNFGLDFCSLDNKSIVKSLSTFFSVRSKFDVFEAYCEYWAITMNTLFIAYHIDEEQKIKSRFVINRFHELLKFERMFSMFQMIKILNHMSLVYDDVLTHSTSLNKNKTSEVTIKYKERTNAFSYYVLKNVLMFHHAEFMCWNKTNNTSLLQFQNNTHVQERFVTFIHKHSHAMNFVAAINLSSILFHKILDTRKLKKLYNTTRMSVLEI